MSDSAQMLKGISDRLDLLISISRLAYASELKTKAEEIRQDPVAATILEISTEPRAYGELSRIVAEQTGAAEITVKRKIAELRDTGLLRARKVGRDAYYENSGLLA